MPDAAGILKDSSSSGNCQECFVPEYVRQPQASMMISGFRHQIVRISSENASELPLKN